jgi:hypothetical protein
MHEIVGHEEDYYKKTEDSVSSTQQSQVNSLLEKKT